MSRHFVNPSATRRVELGDDEWVDVREHWSGVDLIALSDAEDNETRIVRLLNRGIVAWSLRDDDGKPVPLDLAHIKLLDTATLGTVAEAINATFEDLALPNASGGNSPAGSPGTASRTRKARKTS